MDQRRESSSTNPKKSENNLPRSQSQDLLDSSSASSLSCFIDPTDAQNSCSHASNRSDKKFGECSPNAPMDEALKSEKAFIEFVMSLPPKESTERHHRSTDSVISKNKTSAAAAGSTTKVGLDHLDNLCKLMEQLSELRDTNNKLQRRVQYLEDLKTLHDMHKEISDETQYSSEDALSNKPRTYELKKSATETCCPKKDEIQALYASRNPSKYQSRRSRNQITDGQRRERSKSVGHEDTAEDTKSKRIFPKWSKLKEAFGWESDRKDSVKMKSDCDTGNIRTPRRCSDDSRHSFHHANSPTWSHDFPSLHSSLEDISEILDSGRWKRCSVASEKNVLHIDTPKECLRRQKSTPSPGSEKILSYREAADLKPKSSTIERDTYSQQDYSKFDKDDGKRGKSPWGRVKTIIERRRDSLKRRSLRRDHACIECSSVPLKKPSDASEIKNYTDYADTSTKLSHTGDSCKHKQHYPPDSVIFDQEVDYGGPRTPSSSPSFHRKSRWTRVKKALKGKKEDEHDPSLSTPASPNSAHDGHFPFDVNEEELQDSFHDGREIKRVGSDSHVHQMALSAPTCDLMLQLQRNLSEDFHKKIMEWERMRSSGNVSCSPQWDRKPSMMIRSRKKSERDDKNIKPKFKDLTWLEKELQKIEKEKQRLSKEKQKYEERALRLEKLKETVLNAKNSNKREVFVRTSAGEFRFEGISDAFTKKLYEWETKRGLGPELSTIALLDSSRLTISPKICPKGGPLQRVVSRSESSIVDIGQPSHNSSNSLPSLKIPDSNEADRTNHPSRANSEPDLSTLVALTNESTISVTNLSRHVDDSLEDELANPGVSRESEEDDLDKKRNDSETYYGLLEENVILLEQLKDKEEICRRLQNELEVLDKKVDVMDKHHTQETELYREKLWEMHKPGATPRDVQCCLRTMAQLRKRIEVLEKFTEKLRNDRESVEDSFRYHSKQQEDMTLDLLQKMSELQAAGSSTTECETENHIPPQINVSAIERLQDLSALLVKQTQELQETLSAKTRQICQLRWELLHRDLSTVKLETELHTHNAHRKRSKYAHYRSHSSEEAPTVQLPEDFGCGKSAIITESYYNSTAPESEFKATQLTNTVQELNKEVLKLASATEHPSQEHENLKAYPAKINNETSWNKNGLQTKSKQYVKQITVRRSSADNINAVFGNEEQWKHNASSSVDSDDSSDDDYTKVSWQSDGRPNYLKTTSSERLLMSYGEHPPRSYLQRRKKLQKQAKIHPNPNRRRSNTFHNKRDFEKPVVCENVPQKCHSFRFPNERCFDYSKSNNKLDTINIRTLLGEVKYQEFLNKRAQLCNKNTDQSVIPINKNTKWTASNTKNSSQWLREVASDSKIPLLFRVQCQNNEQPKDKIVKYPVRSMSDKHKKETAVERRENFQKRKNRKQLTSPDLYSSFNQNLNKRMNANNASQHKATKSNIGKDANEICNDSGIKHQNSAKNMSKSPSNIPCTDTDTATVTIHLPKRKMKKVKSRMHDNVQSENISENTEQTITVIIPRKRSISSEKEFENSVKSRSNIHTNQMEQIPSFSRENSIDVFMSISQLCRENESTNDNRINALPEPQLSSTKDCETNDRNDVKPSSEIQQVDQISRKRKADDGGSSPKTLTAEKEVNTNQTSLSNLPNSKDSSSMSMQRESNMKCDFTPTYIKSPSAPQLNWRKVCAKKVSREERERDAPNVRSLIEKYNKVAESQSLRRPYYSNVNSPISSRKISSPIFNSKRDHVVTHHSFSTPTTPSVISASSFYNPLIFKPVNLDLFSKNPPTSPMSLSRKEALKKAKEQFISSQHISMNFPDNSKLQAPSLCFTKVNDDVKSENQISCLASGTAGENKDLKKLDEDRMSNSSMDSTSLVMFRTGESCQESRLSKRSADYSKTDSDTLDRHKLKTSKSLSNSSIFKTVLSSDFKMPTTLLKLRRSKRKKDMATVSQLCRRSLLLTSEDTGNVSTPSLHKSCPSSPELKSKNEVKSSWFQRNILRHK